MAKQSDQDDTAQAHQADAPQAELEAPKTAQKKPNRAKDIVRAKVLREAAERAAQDRIDNETKVYFLHCPRVGWNKETNKGHMAAFLTEKPRVGGVIEPENWESFMHPAGEPWHHRYIPCQECFLEGEERAWEARVRPLPGVRDSDGSTRFVIADSKYAVGEVPREILAVKREQIRESIEGRKEVTK